MPLLEFFMVSGYGKLLLSQKLNVFFGIASTTAFLSVLLLQLGKWTSFKSALFVMKALSPFYIPLEIVVKLKYFGRLPPPLWMRIFSSELTLRISSG